MRLMQLFKDSIIVTSISVGILFGTEMALRLIFPERVLTIGELGYEFNDDYLVSLVPNIEKEFLRKVANGGYITRWKTNSHSFRGGELEADPGYRIIIYGDSNVQARFSNEPDTFPAQLATSLKMSGHEEVEVVNAGVIGFGPDQSLIRFKKEVDQFNPDLVIFHLFSDNDFGDLIRNRLFELDAKGHLVTTRYAATVDERLTPGYRRRLKAFVKSLLIVRQVKRVITNLTSEASLPDDARAEIQGNLIEKLQGKVQAEYRVYEDSRPREFSNFGDHYDLDVATDLELPSSRAKIALMEAVLKQADTLARSRGVRFLVVIQPAVIDLTISNAILNYEYLQAFPGYKPTNLTDTLEDICTSQDIDVLNLIGVFQDNDPATLFFRAKDDHWNNAGQKLAAEKTAEFVLRNFLIE